MTRCRVCSSFAINHHAHGRDGSDADLCDVCYWHARADIEMRRVAAERERWESKAREMATNYRSNGLTAEADGLESLVTAARGHWA